MANIKNNVTGQETRRKLIEAAGEVFAERGLHGATIKEITERAGANMASINYHFRDKFELYAVVVQHALCESPPMPPEGLAGTPEDRLRGYIAYVIRDLLDPNRPKWRATVLAHELAQPTAALDAVMDELIKPRADMIKALVRDILGPDAPEMIVWQGAFSIAAQCFQYLHSGEMLRLLEPEFSHQRHGEELAAHIAEFSLAGLRAVKDRLSLNAKPVK